MQLIERIDCPPAAQTRRSGGVGAYGLAAPTIRDGASVRLTAAMAEPSSPGGSSPFADLPFELDRQYYRRRSIEEAAAARAGGSQEARTAHLQLAAGYAQRARWATPALGVASVRQPFAERARVARILLERFGLSAGARAMPRDRSLSPALAPRSQDAAS